MKNTFKYIFAAVSSALLLASCNLEQLPTSAVEYKEGSRFIATANDLASYEAGIMLNFRAIHGGSFAVMEDVMMDGFNAVAGFGNNYGSVHRTDDSYTAGDTYIESYWNNHYYVIKDYNVLIDALNDEINIPEGYEADARVIQGEAYLFRADAYLNLIRHFAKNYNPDLDDPRGVPLVLHYDLYARPARASVHEVYTQIKSDLDSAAVRLKNVRGEIAAQYPTIDAVNAMYARYYLDIQDYDNAAKSADAVISTGVYTLASTSQAMQDEYRNDSGTEPIMQMYGSLSEMPSSITAYTGMTSTQEHGVASSPMFIPSKKLVDSYGEGDLRKAAWFATSDFWSRVNGSFYRGNFATFTKFLGNPALYTNGIPNGAQMCKPYKISELYLIKAEALAAQNKISSAKEALNALQTARKATVTNGRMESIQKEWFRETAGEGMRFVCLKRWEEGFSGREGQPGAVAVNAIETGTFYDQRSIADNDYHMVWPIPSNQIKLNDNLIQNDVYGNN